MEAVKRAIRFSQGTDSRLKALALMASKVLVPDDGDRSVADMAVADASARQLARYRPVCFRVS